MFFLFGRDEKQKTLEFRQTILCPICGKYGRYRVFMTYSAFCFFFIPIFQWNRQYYVRTNCCSKQLILNPQIGKQIRKGMPVTITGEDLTEEEFEEGASAFRNKRRQWRRNG
ncbi:MAG: zinc ribbon domain-containing protein [Lachnospiraceae bacterium]|nr:zinc ribbon domain-containing protein [Lachnospiraceae bacterium]